MNRREFLAGLGSTYAVTVSGCVAGSQDPSNGGSQDPSEPKRTWSQIGVEPWNSNYAPGSPGIASSPAREWVALEGQTLADPIGLGNTLYVTDDDREDGGLVGAVDAETGDVLWRNTEISRTLGPLAARDEAVYVLSRENTPEEGGNTEYLHAFDAATGDEQWAEPVTASGSPPTITDQRIYIGSNTGVTAVDVESGSIPWSIDLDDHVVETDSGVHLTIWAKPAVADGLVYTFDQNEQRGETRSVYALRTRDGDREWATEVPVPDTDTSERIKLVDLPVVADGLVFVAISKETLVATSSNGDGTSESQRESGWLAVLDATSGDVVTIEPFEGTIVSPPVVARERVILPLQNAATESGSELVAYRPDEESIDWRYDPDALLSCWPAATTDAVYVTGASSPYPLQSIDLSSGEQVWSFPLEEYTRNPVVIGDSVYLSQGSRPDDQKGLVAVR